MRVIACSLILQGFFFGGLYHNRVANPGLLPAGREGNEILCLLRNGARDSFTSNQWAPLYS